MPRALAQKLPFPEQPEEIQQLLRDRGGAWAFCEGDLRVLSPIGGMSVASAGEGVEAQGHSTAETFLLSGRQRVVERPVHIAKEALDG